MKKVVLATIMVALMMATVFHVNAVSVQKEPTIENNQQEYGTVYGYVKTLRLGEIVGVENVTLECMYFIPIFFDPRTTKTDENGYYALKLRIEPVATTIYWIRIKNRPHTVRGVVLTYSNPSHQIDFFIFIPPFRNNVDINYLDFINQFPLLNQLLQLV